VLSSAASPAARRAFFRKQSVPKLERRDEMKQLAVVVAAALFAWTAAVPAIAQSTMAKEGSAAAKTQGPSYKASGTITKVDPAAGRVTIAHGAIQALKWPAMTMAFGVSDKALLDRAQPGKKIDFEIAKQGTSWVITEIK
jgi:Cu/Ag efflux protein CusF